MDEVGSPNTMVVMPPLPLGKPFPPHSSSPQLALISFLSCSSPSCYIQFQLAPSPILDMSSPILDMFSPILDMYGVLLFGTQSYDPCPHSRALQQMGSPLSETHFVSDADTNYSRNTDFPQDDGIKSEM